MNRRFLTVVVLAFLALVGLPGGALAHGEMEEPPGQGAMTGPGHAQEEGEMETPNLEVLLPEEVELGEAITVRAILTDPHDGAPIPDAVVIFEAPTFWGEEFQGHRVVGAATTDRRGTATIRTELRTSGDVQITAVFQGGGGFGAVEGSEMVDVHGDTQLYEPKAGLHIPGLNLWVLAAVISLVWAVFFVVGLRVLAIARPRPSVRSATSEPSPVTATASPAGSGATSRRTFLGRLLPLGAQAGIAAIGAGLVTIVARSPRTHGNLMAPPTTVDYHRTPVAHVGQMMEMREMPAPFDREVSFSNEVLPIFLANGGPHVVAPEHSPPPGGLRLDSYEGVMAKEGVVLPGQPEESELVEHLLSVGMQMPPSLPPIPDEQIRLIVSWIAQGARNN